MASRKEAKKPVVNVTKGQMEPGQGYTYGQIQGDFFEGGELSEEDIGMEIHGVKLPNLSKSSGYRSEKENEKEQLEKVSEQFGTSIYERTIIGENQTRTPETERQYTFVYKSLYTSYIKALQKVECDARGIELKDLTDALNAEGEAIKDSIQDFFIWFRVKSSSWSYSTLRRYRAAVVFVWRTMLEKQTSGIDPDILEDLIEGVREIKKSDVMSDDERFKGKSQEAIRNLEDDDEGDQEIEEQEERDPGDGLDHIEEKKSGKGESQSGRQGEESKKKESDYLKARGSEQKPKRIQKKDFDYMLDWHNENVKNGTDSEDAFEEYRETGRVNRNKWKHVAIRTLFACLSTGLRPTEWLGAEEIEPSAKGFWRIRVKNAKNTNGRAHGEFREIEIEDKHPLTDMCKQVLREFNRYNEIMYEKYEREGKQVGFGDVKYPSHTYSTFCNRSLRVLMKEQYRGTKKKIPKYVLYTGRHQFSANLKASEYFTVHEMAYMMGHASTKTASQHYGKKRVGWRQKRIERDTPIVVPTGNINPTNATDPKPFPVDRVKGGSGSKGGGAKKPKVPVSKPSTPSL